MVYHYRLGVRVVASLEWLLSVFTKGTHRLLLRILMIYTGTLALLALNSTVYHHGLGVRVVPSLEWLL